MEMEVPVLSFADLYGGKICAALDRQHPRDLFDIKLLSEVGSLNEKKFLLSVKMGNSDFSLLSISGLENLPAIKWKVENILRMEPKKRITATEKLKSILNLSQQ